MGWWKKSAPLRSEPSIHEIINAVIRFYPQRYPDPPADAVERVLALAGPMDAWASDRSSCIDAIELALEEFQRTLPARRVMRRKFLLAEMAGPPVGIAARALTSLRRKDRAT